MVPFLITAVLAGFAAWSTHCVLAMVPLTVSFFLPHSGKAHHRPITLAAAYCLGIVGAILGLGMLVSIWGSADALHRIANNGWMSVVMGGVLVYFGLNLLGLYAIRAPSWLLPYTSGRERRWDIVVVLFLAMMSMLISGTSLFAFIGLLVKNATQGELFWPLLGATAFSAAFALPFFFVAVIPSVLHLLPRSGRWMNVVKVIVGLIDLGAALSFFGMADRAWHETAWLFDFQLVITVWIIISLSAGLYLLGLFRLPHDTPRDHIGVLPCVSAITCFGLAAYLAVGLIADEKPQGKLWGMISTFILPHVEVESEPFGPYLKYGPLKYSLDFHQAIEFAARQNRPVFIDFTSVNSTNCRQMETGTMSQPVVVERLSKFVRVQLFCDRVPLIEDKVLADRLLQQNIKLHSEWFDDVSLPAYAIIPPDLKSVGNPKALLANLTGIADPEIFAKFLDKGLSRWHAMNAHIVRAPRVGKR